MTVPTDRGVEGLLQVIRKIGRSWFFYMSDDEVDIFSRGLREFAQELEEIRDHDNAVVVPINSRPTAINGRHVNGKLSS
jgi:hypothetical protein